MFSEHEWRDGTLAYVVFSLSNKSDGKSYQEIKSENIMPTDVFEKKRHDAKKIKCDDINHDPAATTYISASNNVVYLLLLCLLDTYIWVYIAWPWK